MCAGRSFEFVNLSRLGNQVGPVDPVFDIIHAVDRADKGFDGSRHGIRIHAGTPGRDTFFIGQAEVGDTAGFSHTVQVMFRIGQVLDVQVIGGADGILDRIELAVAAAFQDDLAAGGPDEDPAVPGALAFLHREVLQFDRQDTIDVIVLEEIEDFIGFQFLMAVIGNFFDEVTEVFTHRLWHIDAVVGLHDEAHTALAGLAVDPDDIGIVGAAHVVGIDIEVRAGPVLFLMFFPIMHALGDGILMGTGEGGKDKLARVGLTVMDMHPRDFLIRLDQMGHIGEIQARVDAESVHVHADGDDIRVAGPFPVAEEGTFHTVRTGEHRHFRIRHARAAVIVRMDGEHDIVTVVQTLRQVGYLGGKDVGHGHLHGAGQVDDALVVRAGIRKV